MGTPLQVSDNSSDHVGEVEDLVLQDDVQQLLETCQRFCIVFCPLISQLLMFYAAVSYRTFVPPEPEPGLYFGRVPGSTAPSACGRPYVFNCVAAVYLGAQIVWNVRPKAKKFMLFTTLYPLVLVWFPLVMCTL